VRGKIDYMSGFLRILENEVQLLALLFLVFVYLIRLVWLFRFRSRKERTFPVGKEGRGIARSLMNVAMPWGMESTRKHPGFYVQFVIFHIGVAAAIATSFIIPYWPSLFEIQAVVRLFQVAIAGGLIVGLMRLYRRIAQPRIRFISTPDDYLSLIFMILFFAAAVLAVPNEFKTAEWPLILFFGLTAFLIIFVPFSKISHYLYYPFGRFFLGRTLGHRGILPSKKSSKE